MSVYENFTALLTQSTGKLGVLRLKKSRLV